MKKISSIIGSLLVFAGASSAQAATVTSNAGLTFTSGGTCSVNGNIVNLGNFSATDTVSTYVDKFGRSDVSTTLPTAPVQLTTVTCTDQMAYTLAIKGAEANNVARVKRAGAVPVNIFDVVPQLTQINSASITKQFIHGDTTSNTYSGVGNGIAQVFYGYWNAYNPTAGQLTTPLLAGNYSADAVATVSF